MIYKGQFADINNKIYKIEINTNNGINVTHDLVMGDEPVIIEYIGGETIYKPCKYSTATIKLVTSDYLFDLYASKAQQCKVTIKDNSNNIIWVGFLTPNLYNMGYEKVIEEIELEAIDALSTLQYFHYSPINESKQIVTFENLIIHLLKKANSYTSFYFPNSFNSSYILNKLIISEENFYDEDGDAMTYQEVIEEVCQFFGLTLISRGDSLIFIDYDRLKDSSLRYTKINLSSSLRSENVVLTSTKTINGDDYAENGGQISLDNVYNKVSIVDSLYSYDTLLPSVFENTTNITSDSDEYIQVKDPNTITSIGYYGEVISDNGNNVIVFIKKLQAIYATEYCVEAIQYFESPNYDCHRYQMDTTVKDKFISYNQDTFNYTDTVRRPGAYIAKAYGQTIKKNADEVDEDIKGLINQDSKLEAYLASNNINKFDYDDYIIMTNHPLQSNNQIWHILNDNATSYPYITSSIKNASCLFGGENAYIMIGGSYFIHPYTGLDDPCFPFDSSVSEYYSAFNDKTTVMKDDLYLVCRMKWGDRWWNGKEWTSTTSSFKLEFIKGDDNYSYPSTMWHELKIKSNVVFNMGIGEDGYVIKCPNNGIIEGMPQLTIYKPMDVRIKNKKGKVSNQIIMMGVLKNFEIKAILGDPTFSDNKESDTEYLNVIDEDFVSELDSLEYKICTWDNKEPNYSCVGYVDGSNKTYLDKVTFKNNSLRMEEHMIERLVNQYSTPSIILNLNLKNNNITPYTTFSDKFMSNKIFIIDSYSLDLKQNKNSLKLVEKKL